MITLEELTRKVTNFRQSNNEYQRKHKRELYWYAKTKGFTPAEARILSGQGKKVIDKLAKDKGDRNGTPALV